MTSPIRNNISTTLNPFGPQWDKSSQASQESRTVGQQIQQTLFGKAKPAVLDPAQHPALAEQIRGLTKYKRKFASLAGDKDDDYELVLADGTIAMIDDEGKIYLGANFLKAFRNQPEVILGALAHEIGHRPKRWKNYDHRRELSQEERNEVCRIEETRADHFAGRALAELGIDPEPVIEFLKNIEQGPHPEYFPADVRGQVIRESFHNQKVRVLGRRKFFSEQERMHGARGHLGEY